MWKLLRLTVYDIYSYSLHFIPKQLWSLRLCNHTFWHKGVISKQREIYPRENFHILMRTHFSLNARPCDAYIMKKKKCCNMFEWKRVIIISFIYYIAVQNERQPRNTATIKPESLRELDQNKVLREHSSLVGIFG